MIKEITEINISKKDDNYYNLLENFREKSLKEYISKRINEIKDSFVDLCNEFDNRFKNNEWILMTDNIYYINEIVSLIPNLSDSEVSWHFQSSSLKFTIEDSKLEFGNYIGMVPNEDEVKCLFGKCNPFKLQNGKIRCCDIDYDGLTIKNGEFITYNDLGEEYISKYGTQEVDKTILTIPVAHLDEIDNDRLFTSDLILKWIKKELRPSEFNSDGTRRIYNLIRYIYNKEKYRDFLKSDLGNITFTDEEKLKDTIYFDCLAGAKFNFLEEVNYILNEKKEFDADDDFLEIFENKFLECDNKRARIDIYPREQLYGINLGHWDLFGYNESVESDIKVKLKEPVYAKEPKDDIVNTEVAIDFGTKSTVVSYRDDNPPRKVIPINVGTLNNAPDITDYENPSIMYFIDFITFLKNYNSKISRPNTNWDELTISHDALNSLKGADERNFESFLIDLKSWCNSNKGNRVKDRINKKLVPFKPFLAIGEHDPNPIEYYAYFLGLYINNMNRGKIFTKYKMSFPVKYKPELRNKIMDSFKKGIKKSLPKLFSNEEDITVEFGVSEPEAYAFTALDKYNFKPRENEKFYYSVFDFGGGTTDFDFGVYCGLSKEEKEKHNYRLIHFGEGGDENLGGEKLLKYLAFEIFKFNKENLVIENGTKIKFTFDDIRTASDCVDFDDFIKNDSIFANRNMYNLMEKIRWVWEGEAPDDSRIVDEYNNGLIYVDLIDEKGILKPMFCLSLYKDNNDGTQTYLDLKELLKNRMEKTIELFFKSMKEGFKKASKDKKHDLKDLNDINEISIFLAGNSTKSVLFRNILNSYVNDELQQTLSQDYSMSEYAGNEVISSYSSSLNCKAKKILELSSDSPLKFRIYPPLGTDEAMRIQESLGYHVDVGDKTEPTGKTGVAYGLLLARRIKVENTLENSSVGFQFYVGREIDDLFEMVLEKGCQFGEWKYLCKTEKNKKNYPFLYTKSPDATSGCMSAIEAGEKEINLEDTNDDEKIYICADSQNSFKYRVVKNEKELCLNLDESQIIEL